MILSKISRQICRMAAILSASCYVTICRRWFSESERQDDHTVVILNTFYQFIEVSIFGSLQLEDGSRSRCISAAGFQWGSCYSIFSFMCMLCRSMIVLFPLAIMLSVLRYADSGYPFDIFKLFYRRYFLVSIQCPFFSSGSQMSSDSSFIFCIFYRQNIVVCVPS